MGQIRAYKLSEGSDLALLLLYPTHPEKHVTHSKHSYLLFMFIAHTCSKILPQATASLHCKVFTLKDVTSVLLWSNSLSAEKPHRTGAEQWNPTGNQILERAQVNETRGVVTPLLWFICDMWGVRPSSASSSNIRKARNFDLWIDPNFNTLKMNPKLLKASWRTNKTNLHGVQSAMFIIERAGFQNTLTH